VIEQSGSQLYDPNVEPHHHFRCRSGGGLIDVHVGGLDAIVPADPGLVAERTQIVFEGLCDRCGPEVKRRGGATHGS
jgi:Fur family peroxide stress response transcriptional regulator